MINVLMIGNHPTNKGGMTSVINQIRNHDWNQEGINLSFIPTYMPGNPIKKIIFFSCSYLKILFRFITNKPDVVHMHMSYKGSFTRKYAIHKLCKRFNIKDIIHLHGSEFEKWFYEVDEEKRKNIKTLLSEANCFIVLGEGWKNIVKTIEPATKVAVISNGIEIPKETVQWNEDYCQALFLGVLIPRKGVSDLIKAVEIIKDKGVCNLRFAIAGTGEEEEKLKELVTEKHLEDLVSFVGWVAGDKKRNLLLESQVLVSPSYNEGLPISILEAASYGMPIVSTDVGDISMIVRDGINGYLINPGEVEDLAKAIMNASLRENFERMSFESRKKAEESFSIDVFYIKLLEIYRSVGEANG